MIADIKLTNSFRSKFKRSVEVAKIKKTSAKNFLDNKVLIRARDLYPNVPLYTSGKVFIILYLRKIVQEGYVVGPDSYSNSHLHWIKDIYFYKESL